MPQGKFKKPKSLKGVAEQKQKSKKDKIGAAFTRRANAPIRPKKIKMTEMQKIKQVISKSVNKSVESDLRSRATEGDIKLSKAQEAVAKQNQSMSAPTSSVSSVMGD